MQPIYNYKHYTQLYNLYTTIQPLHNKTAYTQLYSLYTTIRPIHNYTAYTQLYSLYPTINTINQTPTSRKNLLVTGVRWLGIVYLVTLKNLNLLSRLKISFALLLCNYLQFYIKLFNSIIYGLLEDH